MNRRELLYGGAAALAFTGLGGYVLAQRYDQGGRRLADRQPLRMPPVLDVRETGVFSLQATGGETAFVPGAASRTLGFNGAYLGPTVRVRSGKETRAEVTNALGATTSVHWHGLVVPGDVDGGVHLPIAPGETWRPVLPVHQTPNTAWYHAHVHPATAEQVYAGLAGMLLVEDGSDVEAGLPSDYGVDDLVLVLQDKRLDAAGRAIYEPGMMDVMHGYLGDAMLVNGQLDAVATVPSGLVRLRLLNAANSRTFHLAFEDGRDMHLVGTDGGLLPAPVTLDRLRISPGERYEVLVDFSDERPALLASEPDMNGMFGAGMMQRMRGLAADLFSGTFPVLAFAPSGRAARIQRLPDVLPGADLEPRTAVTERRFELQEGMGAMMGGRRGMMGGGRGGFMMISDRTFDPSRIDFTARAGTGERWIVASEMMAHPFHVHGARFRVLAENGGPPAPQHAGWKDVVLVEESAELLVEFDREARAETPFMFHCHILEHEDAGMMGQFTVAA